jgi:hypothetical protein
MAFFTVSSSGAKNTAGLPEDYVDSATDWSGPQFSVVGCICCEWGETVEMNRQMQLRLSVGVFVTVCFLAACAACVHTPSPTKRARPALFLPVSPPTLSGEKIDDFFPLHLGTTWTYTFSDLNEDYEVEGATMGTYTERVVMITTGPSDEFRLIGIEQEGESMLSPCYGSTRVVGDLPLWYVTDNQRLYAACSQWEAFSIAESLVGSSEDGETDSVWPPQLVVPIDVGDVWPAFPGGLSEPVVPDYNWHVEAKADVNVPAGVFTDCFKISLRTLPDAISRWVCPGVGVAAMEYHHSTVARDYRAELREIGLHTGP